MATHRFLPQAVDVDEMQKALALLMEASGIVELRLLNVVRGKNRPVTISGYFNDPAQVAKAVLTGSVAARGTYITLNPVNPSLLARSANRSQVADRNLALTTDTDIVGRRWLPIDLDPVRPSGVSSTDEEHQAAIERAFEIRTALNAEGWPEPLVADSGNGAHLLYRIDLEPGDGELVKRCLIALAGRFDDDLVTVDQTVFNPSRIWKLYGTVTRKGDSTPERPHRVSRILEGNPTIVSRALLEGLGQQAVLTPQFSAASVRQLQVDGLGGFDLEAWLLSSSFQIRGPRTWQGGRRWVFPICPWNPEHRDRSAFVIQFANGALSAGCHHNGCQGKKWADLRALIEPVSRGTYGPSNSHRGQTVAWEPPVPFHRHELPAFPIDVFPDWLRSFVAAQATATQTPVDLPAMLALSVLAAAGAKKVVAGVKDGYCEPVNIFTVTALPSGNRKSAVFSAVKKPLEEYEQIEARKSAPDIARSLTNHRIKEATLKRLQDKAANADSLNREALTREATEAAEALEAMVVKTATRYLADDCTPERLSALLLAQGGRIAVMSPEGDVFDLMAGRYSKNGTGNFGVYLRGHAGDDIRIDRINRPPEFVKEPALTMGLAVQPDVIQGLAQNPGFRGRGLLARFLYAMPASLLGRRDTNAEPVPASVLAEYRKGVFAILDLIFARDEHNEPTPHTLKFDSEAKKGMQDFEAWIEPQLLVFGELGAMTDWGGKLFGAVARITGLLHLAEHAGDALPWHTPISRNTVDGAVRIGHFLIAHSKAAFADMGMDPATASATKVLRWIDNNQLAYFTKRDLHQSLRSHFKRVTDLDAPLLLLIGRGFVRNRFEVKEDCPGRPPSPIYDVNPLWQRGGGPQKSNSEHCEDSETPLKTMGAPHSDNSEYCEDFETASCPSVNPSNGWPQGSVPREPSGSLDLNDARE